MSFRSCFRLIATLGLYLSTMPPVKVAFAQELFVLNFDSSTQSAYPTALLINGDGSLSPVHSVTTAGISVYGGIAVAPSGQFFYLSVDREPGVYAVDPLTAEIRPFPNWQGYSGPMFQAAYRLALSPSGFLYGIIGDGVVGYAVNAETASLTLVSSTPAVTVYPIASSPIRITSGGYLYVNTTSPDLIAGVSQSYIEGFKINSATGSLTRLAGPSPQIKGIPYEFAVDPLGRFLYEPSGGGILVYSINRDTGLLTLNPASPFPAGLQSFSICPEPSGKFLYYTDPSLNAIYGFSVDQLSGALTAVPGSPYASGNQPISAVTDAAGSYLYVANSLSNTIGAFAINKSNGSLTPVPGSPFPSTGPQVLAVGAFPTSRLSSSLPGAVKSGASFTVEVTAQDRNGNTMQYYPGTLHFTSSDPRASIPADAGLIAGRGAFTVTMQTPGAQMLTISDTNNPGLIATANISILPNISFVNAASLQTTSGAPNTILTAFGDFSQCTSGAQVLVNGAPAGVFYASSSQINFLMPSSVAGTSVASIQVSCAGASAVPISLPVLATAPALFTTTEAGSGPVAVVNQDGSLNTPSPRGTVVELYGTGFGLLKPPDANGLSDLLLPVNATVGGVQATVVFAGQAPGFTAGLQQIDLLIPSTVPAGSLPIVLSVGGNSTQPGVTLQVQ